jgi:glycosyltransferase involved in cell wall biosynthesis
MNGMISNLKRVKWIGREEKYGAAFKEVKFNNTVENPAASVIIISWRFVEGLEKNISLLTSKRDAKFEIIFVNNGKEDEEFSSILPYIDTYVSLKYNTGAYIARNIGSLFAKAPILIFLEDDGIIADNFVNAHLSAYEKYAIISVRGVCRPLTQNPLNKLAKHYYMGKKPFPAIANLEGNCSYYADAFFAVGGWSDEINFGHGGPELSYRLTKKFPDQRMQIYYPDPVIYHDYASSEEHLKNKKAKQKASYDQLKLKYPDWEEFFETWRKFYRKRYTIHKKKNNTLLESVGDFFDYLNYGVARPVYRFLFRR